MLNNKWLHIASKVDFLFEPIVNIHTGIYYGVYSKVEVSKNFKNLDEIFKKAHKDKFFEEFTFQLFKNLIKEFNKFEFSKITKLFYSIPQSLININYIRFFQELSIILEKESLSKQNLIISINYSNFSTSEVKTIIEESKKIGFKSMIYNLNLEFFDNLNELKTNFLEIEKELLINFIKEICLKDDKERNFREYYKENNINLIISKIDYKIKDKFYGNCFEFDLIKGKAIAPSKTKTKNLNIFYPKVVNLKNKLNIDSENINFKNQIDYIPPLIKHKNTKIIDVLDYFHLNHNREFIPVIDENLKPIGIIKEEKFKFYMFSKYGWSIVNKTSFSKKLEDFITPISSAEINVSIEELISIYIKNREKEGVMISENESYIGFLHTNTLLNMFYLKKVAEQEKMLIQQSKMATMGEMIGAIAHQWRQPLNAISIFIQAIEDRFEYEELNEEFINEVTIKVMEQVEFMSKTIDDFRNFFKPNKEKEIFSIKDALEKSLSILHSQLKNNSIEIDIRVDDFKVNGYLNEFKQVLLNIINNAKDAILEKKKKDEEFIGKIKINSFVENNKGIITIKDNGGGISQKVMERIFEPYFTTKDVNGTGIGLYMSKMIIVDHMRGNIYVKNMDDGAIFYIELKFFGAIMKSYKFLISGKVQGVWYRKSIFEKAIKLNIKGYVKNLNDGRVEASAMLDEKNYNEFKSILQEGSPASIVEEIKEEIISKSFDNFEIRY